MSDVMAMILQFSLMLIGMLMGHHRAPVCPRLNACPVMCPRILFYMNRLWDQEQWEMLAYCCSS